MADSMCSVVWFANANVVNRVPYGGVGVMVWAGISYGQRTQVNFIDGSLNAQRYRDEIPRPIVVPFIHHHLMLQHGNARPHIARICTQFPLLLEASVTKKFRSAVLLVIILIIQCLIKVFFQDKTAHFTLAFYSNQSNTDLCTNHTI